jgi:site-specific DNA-methyltransferase (adenine-specific)
MSSTPKQDDAITTGEAGGSAPSCGYPRPYYQRDGITIYHGDCLEVMQGFSDGEFALVHTDPPFGMGNFVQTTGRIMGRGANRGRSVSWNDAPPPMAVFEQIRRVGRHRIIWGANFFNCFEPAGGAIVWLKGQKMPNFSKADIASCTHFKKTETVSVQWTNFTVAQKAETDHPCERPVSLYRWCLNYIPGAREGTVLDPFMGSGTTLVAARLEGRDAVGIEAEERYCEIAAKRLSQGVLF